MGNISQPLQARAKVAKQAPSRTSTALKPHPRRSASRLLLMFAQRHPFLCLFAVWGAFLYFGWLAVTGLAYTNPDPIAEPPKPEAVAEAPKPFRIDTPATSFGLLAVVAGSCAVTSVLLARQLRPVKSSRKTVKRVVVQPRPTRPQPTASRRPPMPIAQPNMPAPPARQAATTARPVAAKPPAPSITVLSSEEDSPFEMHDPSLAEMMDIRRQA